MSGALLLSGMGASPWLPVTASETAARFDALFTVLFYVSAFFFVLVVAATAYFTVRYRRKKGSPQPPRIEGNRRLEILWTVIPAVILVVFFVLGFRDFLHLSVPPAHALDVRVTGQQWSWSFDYPKEGISTNELVVPVGKPVKLTMSSRDVIHSFFVPAFRIKRDVLPNRYTVLWFTAEAPGTYDVLCAEYCGTAHSNMLAQVKALPH
jgi:cytochrome c oxidase subunit 2